MGNIWELNQIVDLVQILKETKDKYIIIGLTKKDISVKVINSIKRFFKEKAQKHNNMIFLYYKVSGKENLARISKLFNITTEQFPIVYYTFGSDILSCVSNTDIGGLKKSFKQLLDYIEKQNEQIPEKETKQDTANENNEGTQKNDKNEKNENIENVDEEPKRIEKPERIITEEKKEELQKIEEKKLTEKFDLFQEKCAEFEQNFIQEMALRRKKEEKK
jgi:hypothetical protein